MKTIFFLSFILSNIYIFSQCTTCPAVPACSGGDGDLSNNQNINGGQTYWYTNSGDNFNINFNGGTLIVCGDLTITNINLNGSSTIHIDSGGSLVINSSLNMNGNVSIYNSGELTFNNNVTLQNSSNILSNCLSSSTLTINASLTINPTTSKFINFGTASINHLALQSNAAGMICLGLSSITLLTSMSNNTLNSIEAPSGLACLYYSGNALLNQDLTSYSDLSICQEVGSTTSGGATFGSATIHPNCSSCSVALPIKLIAFNTKLENQKVKIYWSTATEVNNAFFSIQRSQDGLNFEQVGRVEGAGNSSINHNYELFDDKPFQGLSYYRLKQVDFNGDSSFSTISAIYMNPLKINIYPNPAELSITIFIGTPYDITIDIEVFNSVGQKIIDYKEFIIHENPLIELNISNLDPGNYTIKITTSSGEHLEQKFIKK